MKKYLKSSINRVYILDVIFVSLLFYIFHHTSNIDYALSVVFGLFVSHRFLTRTALEKHYKEKFKKDEWLCYLSNKLVFLKRFR